MSRSLHASLGTGPEVVGGCSREQEGWQICDERTYGTSLYTRLDGQVGALFIPIRKSSDGGGRAPLRVIESVSPTQPRDAASCLPMTHMIESSNESWSETDVFNLGNLLWDSGAAQLWTVTSSWSITARCKLKGELSSENTCERLPQLQATGLLHKARHDIPRSLSCTCTIQHDSSLYEPPT